MKFYALLVLCSAAQDVSSFVILGSDHGSISHVNHLERRLLNQAVKGPAPGLLSGKPQKQGKAPVKPFVKPQTVQVQKAGLKPLVQSKIEATKKPQNTSPVAAQKSPKTDHPKDPPPKKTPQKDSPKDKTKTKKKPAGTEEDPKTIDGGHQIFMNKKNEVQMNMNSDPKNPNSHASNMFDSPSLPPSSRSTPA